VAQRIAREQPADEKQVFQFANELERTVQELQFTINYKRDANYDYWQTRADFEQTDDALAAREYMFRARQAFEDGNLPQAKKLYQDGFAKWRKVIDAFPFIMSDDQTTGDDILEFVKKYRDVLDQLDERLGDDFPLWDVIEKFDREQDFTEELAERREANGQPAAATPPPQAEPAQSPAETAPSETQPAPSEGNSNGSQPQQGLEQSSEPSTESNPE
jgi:hypothetical protein